MPYMCWAGTKKGHQAVAGGDGNRQQLLKGLCFMSFLKTF